MNFFISSPVDLDPYGILKKIEMIMDQSEKRFNHFVDRLAPKMSAEEKANLKFGLIGALGVNQIYKVIRHYVITIKKTNNLQLAMVLQMSMPMLIKIAKANVKATQAFVDGTPIGDAIGPMVAASYKSKEGAEVSRDVIVSKEKVAGKNVFVMNCISLIYPLSVKRRCQLFTKEFNWIAGIAWILLSQILLSLN